MRTLLSLVVVSGLAASAHADPAADVRLRSELVGAINKRDVAAVTSHIVLPLEVRSMWFAASACTKFSGVSINVEEADLPAFVGCVADLGIKHLRGANDTWVTAVYGPGIPLELANDPSKPVRMFNSISPSNGDWLEIEPVTFASHIKKFSRTIAPSRELKKSLDASPPDRIEAKLGICVDRRGKLEANALVTSGANATYEQDVVRAARRWSFKPFKLAGKVTKACATLYVGYPATGFTRPMEMQLMPVAPAPDYDEDEGGEIGGVVGGVVGGASTAPPQNVVTAELERLRIAGDKNIVPDDATKAAIAAATRSKLIASFKLCIDERGAVESVQPLRSTGFVDYDNKIIKQMKTWAYRPYQVKGRAVRVCTAATFIYPQSSMP